MPNIHDQSRVSHLTLEEAELGVQLNKGKSIGCLPFADDFVDISDSSENFTEALLIWSISFVTGRG